jgi:hypothetical protein
MSGAMVFSNHSAGFISVSQRVERKRIFGAECSDLCAGSKKNLFPGTGNSVQVIHKTSTGLRYHFSPDLIILRWLTLSNKFKDQKQPVFSFSPIGICDRSFRECFEVGEIRTFRIYCGSDLWCDVGCHAGGSAIWDRQSRQRGTSPGIGFFLNRPFGGQKHRYKPKKRGYF